MKTFIINNVEWTVRPCTASIPDVIRTAQPALHITKTTADGTVRQYVDFYSDMPRNKRFFQDCVLTNRGSWEFAPEILATVETC